MISEFKLFGVDIESMFLAHEERDNQTFRVVETKSPSLRIESWDLSESKMQRRSFFDPQTRSHIVAVKFGPTTSFVVRAPASFYEQTQNDEQSPSGLLIDGCTRQQVASPDEMFQMEVRIFLFSNFSITEHFDIFISQIV
jgi:hypothetical protein